LHDDKERASVSKDGTCGFLPRSQCRRAVVVEANGRDDLGEKACLDERNEIAVRMRIGAGKVPTAYLLISCCKTRLAS
jgi:hypothetical protein